MPTPLKLVQNRQSNRKAARHLDLPTVRHKHRHRAFGVKLYAEVLKRFNEGVYEFRIKDFKDFALKYNVGLGTVGFYTRAFENERDMEKIGWGLYVLAEEDPSDPDPV
jgi:hypothetical protein